MSKPENGKRRGFFSALGHLLICEVSTL